MPFSTLGLSPSLLLAINQKQYLAPTAIQTAAIPAILRGEDVLASAQTGSGKTAAFVLPILQRLLNQPAQQVQRSASSNSRKNPRALILVPTRELAMQVGQTIEQFAHGLSTSLNSPLKISTLFGGVSINPQMMALRGGTDIVVATPGRLLDLIDHNALSLSAVAMLVLDEADHLLDLGFSDEITRILSLLPEQRQNLFFSATFPSTVQTLTNTILNNPIRIDVPPALIDDINSSASITAAITQRAITVDAKRRTQLLVHLLREHQWSRVLVFVATKYSADYVAEKLRRAGISAAAFHGELSQGLRNQTLAEFKNSKLQVVVATDIAARGIDITQLPVVLNYDLPRSAVDYTHRIGRTGRAGESGIAISFITAETEAHFRLIEKRHGLLCPREQIAGFEPTEFVETAAAPQLADGGIKGKRKSKKDKLREAAAQS